MKILKFGGTSVGSAERIESVINIVSDSIKEHGRLAVVSSAFAKVTDTLIALSNSAIQRDDSYLEMFSELKQRHFDVAETLIAEEKRSEANRHIETLLTELRELLHGLYLIKELTPRTYDYVVSFGERLSCFIIAEAMKCRGINAEFLDARPLIKTDANHGNAKVNFEITNWNIITQFQKSDAIYIVTGFIASTKQNITTTLGRGGSDYTASVLGAALNADEIEIWTDVNGVLTADPRKVKDAFPLEAITYEEAMELSHFGAKVIHPPTMLPAMNKKIPIRIRNTFRPDFKGTLIVENRELTDRSTKGIASIDKICLVTVKGIGMIQASGIVSRIFNALAQKKIDAILITQSSSDHSLCFAILPNQKDEAKEAIELELRLEIHAGEISEVTVEGGYSIIAVVGEEMKNVPGMAGKVFASLGKNGINIVAIAQGSSELNISLLIKNEYETKALNALHDNLFLSDQKTIPLFIVGTGLVGGALLDMINERFKYIQQEFKTYIKVVGLANSRKMIFKDQGIDVSDWRAELDNSEESFDFDKYIKRVKELNLAGSVFVDCTGSPKAIPYYMPVLHSSINIVTSSKLANTQSYEEYQAIRRAMQVHNAQFRYGTNVGAALPIINSLRDLMNNGDKIVKIEAVLSGTLSYIFNTLEPDNKFSDVVKNAKEKGFTEPDPREDLNGLDVARKLLILIRESGISYEMSDIKIESLLSDAAEKVDTVDEFWNVLKESDYFFREKLHEAQKKGRKLMYIAKYEQGKAKIGLEEVDITHPFSSLTGTDNIVAFTTKNFYEKPLVLRGSGAGAKITASGVFTDILRISNYNA